MESLYYVMAWACHRKCKHCYEERFRPYVRGALEEVVAEAERNFPRIVDNLPELLKMKEIDVFYIGQNDLAESMGLKGKRKDPKVQATVEDVIKRVADSGRVAGMNVQEDLEAVTHFMRLGMRYVNVHMKQFMDRGARTFLAGLR